MDNIILFGDAFDKFIHIFPLLSGVDIASTQKLDKKLEKRIPLYYEWVIFEWINLPFNSQYIRMTT